MKDLGIGAIYIYSIESFICLKQLTTYALCRLYEAQEQTLVKACI